jgi:GNAT superfamily N-acetyltransferase
MAIAPQGFFGARRDDRGAKMDLVRSVAIADRDTTVSTQRGRRMTPPIVIRPVLRGDYPAWKSLWDGYNAFYGRTGATALPDDITQMTWARFFDAYEPMHAIVAEGADGLLGLAHYLYHRSTIQLGPSCYMQDLFTLEAARGKGVAHALINDVYERAHAAGSRRVYWQTHETNVSAMRLYDKVAEKSGFIVYRKLT